MTPNQITAGRVAAAFAAVVLFTLDGRLPWFDLIAVGLTIAAIALDGVDGYLARTRGLATPLGAQFDILGDRVVENLFFTFFAVSGLISLWIPVLFFVRGTLTDFLRSLAARAGRGGFGANSMLEAWWSRSLVSSRASRASYAALKCLCFCYLGLLLPLRNVSGTWLAPSSYQSFAAAGQVLVAATAAFCVIRAIPVIWEGRRYLAASEKSPRRRTGKDHAMTSASRIGAFFDLDGTLLAAPSLELRFVRYLLAHGKIGARQFWQWSANCAKTIWRDPRAAFDANKYYLAGLPESSATDWEKFLAPNPGKNVSLPIFAEAIERIVWHVSQGHRIFFVTGTMEPLAHIVTCCPSPRGLQWSAEICATQLETRGGLWTGRIVGEHMSGRAKAVAVFESAARHDLSLAESYAYGNSCADLAMLEAIGCPVAVNPEARLARIARRRGWSVRHWQSLASRTTSVDSASATKVRILTVTPTRKLQAAEDRR